MVVARTGHDFWRGPSCASGRLVWRLVKPRDMQICVCKRSVAQAEAESVRWYDFVRIEMPIVNAQRGYALLRSWQAVVGLVEELETVILGRCTDGQRQLPARVKAP